MRVAVYRDDRYEIDDLGRVWSKCRNGGVPTIIRQTLTPRGYPKVKLGQHFTIMVHLLVAEAFLGPRSPGVTVNHKDGDKLNASAVNLEYVTQGENNRHAWKAGLNRSGWEARRLGKGFTKNATCQMRNANDDTGPSPTQASFG